jgi:hypothetical protein
MSRHLGGVQTLIKQLHPRAVYFHCFNHRSNLVLVDAIKSVPFAADFFALFEYMYLLMTNSAVLEIFNEEKKVAGIDQRVVASKRLSDTS